MTILCINFAGGPHLFDYVGEGPDRLIFAFAGNPSEVQIFHDVLVSFLLLNGQQNCCFSAFCIRYELDILNHHHCLTHVPLP